MNSIPIFDALTHPNIHGDWIFNQKLTSNTVQGLYQEMQEANVRWAFAVEMNTTNSRPEESSYVDLIQPYRQMLFPIAFFDSKKASTEGIRQYLQKLKILGFVGIKIHPRLANVTYLDPRIIAAVKYAAELNLLVLVCTYYLSGEQTSIENNSDALHQFLIHTPETNIILLHGGVTQLLHVAEIAKQFPCVLLDLSFVLCKFEGSSIDFDIQYLFKHQDRRICIGSDSPEYSLKQMRKRFEFFAQNIAPEKKQNIGYRNLLRLVSPNHPDII